MSQTWASKKEKELEWNVTVSLLIVLDRIELHSAVFAKFVFQNCSFLINELHYESCYKPYAVIAKSITSKLIRKIVRALFWRSVLFSLIDCVRKLLLRKIKKMCFIPSTLICLILPHILYMFIRVSTNNKYSYTCRWHKHSAYFLVNGLN